MLLLACGQFFAQVPARLFRAGGFLRRVSIDVCSMLFPTALRAAQQRHQCKSLGGSLQPEVGAAAVLVWPHSCHSLRQVCYVQFAVPGQQLSVLGASLG